MISSEAKKNYLVVKQYTYFIVYPPPEKKCSNEAYGYKEFEPVVCATYSFIIAYKH